ncbi:hypothetical protein CUJ86_02415 [Methanofollis fontis]|uniref:Uncharacterized protein n=1 Tax=Methanofollis fontis TaxID=2052832 RepID=A0A483CX33_9EURY|nr:hypothetical protein CUJ86_02415 [Methanofollis fontis]
MCANVCPKKAIEMAREEK